LARDNSLSQNKKFVSVIRKALPYPTFDIPEPAKPQRTLESFSTERKAIKRKSQAISVGRARQFMLHLWEKKLRECSFGTLEYEFIQLFGTNEPRVLERYLGRPKSVENHPGSTVVRLNRQSGNIAKFDYMNTRRIQPKKGLLEILGYVTQEVNGRYLLNHERFGYSYEQVSMSDLCACDVEAGESKQQQDGTVRADSGDKKEEEDYRLHTHKSRHIDYASKHIADGEGGS
jgi:hypothetical protein